ncbi:OLC1v1010008C1 [Oldenlandia corymbosa var. corymbosa]|uniref:OLC1v1010008C1 n=1 Tax=Oldenlandia corymbosa var. corymbosa TaxID=529605 RepID=A0AAV1DQB4_OLDCO|nr:OLC1v1010008C1 [Oldenlandia corymbosa var. corymbosa]
MKNFSFILALFPSLLLVDPFAINPKAFGPLSSSNSLKRCKFDKIYQLGDSISDTGNLVIESPYGSGFLFNQLPYGETLGNPTGRCSNGLLMIDYFASSAGFPYLNPYQKVGSDFSKGVNFAVAGATVLSSEALMAKGTVSRDGEHSLFMVGEIGGNDYNYALLGGKRVEDLNNLISDVVHSTAEAVRKVISFGATKIFVPGNFRIGCHPIYLSIFQTNDSTSYDSNECLTYLNEFAASHNEALQKAIEQLRTEYPTTSIVYGDYYNAYLSLLLGAEKFGFQQTLRACCGSGGKHNFSIHKLCGMKGVTTACPNPDTHTS